MEFYKTPMGRKFYEQDIPKLIEQLERIADSLEIQNSLIEGGK